MKPIRLLCIAILGMIAGSAKCAQQSDNRQQATELKNAIENKDFQVITLTRPLGNNYPLLLNEIQFLFDDISRAFNTDLLLRNSCNDDVTNLTEILSQAKNEYDKKSRERFFCEDISQHYMDVLQHIKNLKGSVNRETISEYLHNMPKEIGVVPKLNKDKWTFLVCQEGFFSKTHALNDFLVGNIVKYCKLLSEKNQKLIICVNFLHEFESDTAKEWLKNYTAPRNDISKEIVRYNETTPLLAEHKIGAEGFALLEQNYDWALYGKPNFIDETSRNQKIKFQFIGERRLANYSLIIHNGKLVAIYRKGFYAKERDELIRNGYVYEFGDFKTKAIEEFPIFDALFNYQSPLCRLFICADLNLFNEKNYQCKTAKQLNFDDCGLFVIQSNTFAGLSTSQLPYLGMLPSIFANKKSLIIHVDPQYGPSVGFINGRGEFLASLPFVPESVMVTQDGQFECKSTIDTYQYPYNSNGRRIHFGCKGVEFRSNKCIINVWGVVDRNMFPMRNIKRGIL